MRYTINGVTAKITINGGPDAAWRYLAAFIARADGDPNYKPVGREAEEAAKAARITQLRKNARKDQ